jgi:solute carrier family 40 (iron-regulated transporter), member 1
MNTALNAKIRRIDLFCKLAGPLMISLIDGASTKIAILVTLGLSLGSVVTEYVCIEKVWNLSIIWQGGPELTVID